MARHSKDTKLRILTAANRLFYSDGIRAVSVDAIAEKAGITKKTLYYHFKSKDDLVAEYLMSRDQPNLDAMRKWFDEVDGSVGDKVYAIFDGVVQSSKHPKWRGCGFLRTAGELANMPGHPAIKAGAAHKKRFENWLAEVFVEYKLKNSSSLARQVVLLLDGSFAVMMVHHDSAYIEEAGLAAKQLVEASL
jgi:AcrR family transcriptional regulator